MTMRWHMPISCKNIICDQTIGNCIVLYSLWLQLRKLIYQSFIFFGLAFNKSFKSYSKAPLAQRQCSTKIKRIKNIFLQSWYVSKRNIFRDFCPFPLEIRRERAFLHWIGPRPIQYSIRNVCLPLYLLPRRDKKYILAVKSAQRICV